MPTFSTGVSGYVYAKAEIYAHFPIDEKGNPDISCYQCDYFSRSNGTCRITAAVSEYPTRNVGTQCPMREITKDEYEYERKLRYETN